MANSAGTRFEALLSLMARLRGEGGCPWDLAQTRASLKPYLIEEAYEVLQAIDEDDVPHLVEELGDLLFQVVFHSQIASEAREFAMADVLERLIDKMTRRHPHVFGDRTVGTAAEALAQWEAIKDTERAGAPRSVVAGIPRALPALLRADRVQHRAARVGFDWPDPAAATEKVREELGEVLEALDGGDVAATERELGDLLFAVVNVARLAAVDPERALQGAVARFADRFAAMEAAARGRGWELSALSSEEMEDLWVQAKAREGSS